MRSVEASQSLMFVISCVQSDVIPSTCADHSSALLVPSASSDRSDLIESSEAYILQDYIH